MSFLLRLIVKFYRLAISPLLGQNCRFHPSCSSYCEKAIHKFGALKGIWLTIKRICKCHPWNPGGHDPVP